MINFIGLCVQNLVETIKYIFDLWGRKVVLNTKTRDGKDIEIVCGTDRKVTVN